MEQKTVYSPNQVLLGSLWGGPIAAAHFLRSNYLALGKTGEAQKALALGVAFVFALIVILPFLPEKFPNIVLPAIYCVLAKQIATSTQLEKADIAESDDFRFASNWRILGLGILTTVMFFVLAVAVMLIMEFAGLISVD